MKIGGLVENIDLTMYRITSIEDRPGAAGEILKLFAKENVRLQYITESSAPEDTAVMTLCVNVKEAKSIDHILGIMYWYFLVGKSHIVNYRQRQYNHHWYHERNIQRYSWHNQRHFPIVRFII